MTPSLNYLDGAKHHTEHWRFFNHFPEIKPWAYKASAYVSPVVRGMVQAYMGSGYPVESIEWEIIQSMKAFEHLGVSDGMKAYLDAVGRPGRILLAAIRRNFKSKPELWKNLRRGV